MLFKTWWWRCRGVQFNWEHPIRKKHREAHGRTLMSDPFVVETVTSVMIAVGILGLLVMLLMFFRRVDFGRANSFVFGVVTYSSGAGLPISCLWRAVVAKDFFYWIKSASRFSGLSLQDLAKEGSDVLTARAYHSLIELARERLRRERELALAEDLDAAASRFKDAYSAFRQTGMIKDVGYGRFFDLARQQASKA